MTSYILTERTIINNNLTEPGPVEYDGLPTSIFVPVDEEGVAKRAEYERLEAERLAKAAASAGVEALVQLDKSLIAAIRQIVSEALDERLAKPKRTQA
jgi:hypothetical protein